MWVLGCRVFRWGVRSVPHRFLVLIFIIVVDFVGGSHMDSNKSISFRTVLFSIST